MIRWPDGTTTVTGASTKRQALDAAYTTYGIDDYAEVSEIKNFICNITPELKLDAETGLNRLDTYVDLTRGFMHTAYPHLTEMMTAIPVQPEFNDDIEEAFKVEMRRIEADDNADESDEGDELEPCDCPMCQPKEVSEMVH
jgi:hypothetical protein